MKPDNLMVSRDRKKCKLIDFGNAAFVDDVPRVSELLARYYKPPEVILGFGWDCAIDVWSAGCSLFEIFAGCFLFTGASDNEMLRQQMDLRGPVSLKALKKGLFAANHFDLASNSFLAVETDPVFKQTAVRDMPLGAFKPKDLGERLGLPKAGPPPRELLLFKDLLERCLAVDPERRISPEDALRHGFFKKAHKK